jgi:hypothetical protein
MRWDLVQAVERLEGAFWWLKGYLWDGRQKSQPRPRFFACLVTKFSLPSHNSLGRPLAALTAAPRDPDQLGAENGSPPAPTHLSPFCDSRQNPLSTIAVVPKRAPVGLCLAIVCCHPCTYLVAMATFKRRVKGSSRWPSTPVRPQSSRRLSSCSYSRHNARAVFRF